MAVNQGLVAVYVSVILTALSATVLALRCVSRFIILRKGGIDDFIAICAFLSSLAYTTLICLQQAHGLGRSCTEISPYNLLTLFKYIWAATFVYILSITLIKISALTQYLRFLHRRAARIVCWVMVGAIATFGVVNIPAVIFACHPISYAWDKLLPDGKCYNYLAWWYATTAYTVVTDFIVVIIPFVTLKDLAIAPNHKRGLIGVFALGGLGCVTAIPRLFAFYKTAVSTDPTVDNAAASLWCAIELNIGVICISLPPLKALLRVVIPILGRSKNVSEASRELTPVSATKNLQPTSSIQSDIPNKPHGPDPGTIL